MFDNVFKQEKKSTDTGCPSPVEITKGLINNTWIYRDFVIQKINKDVFQDTEAIHKNYYEIENHLKKNSNIRIPKLIEKDGAWRRLEYISSKTFLRPENNNMAFKTAFSFGKFQEALLDLPLNAIKETIPNFHNVDSRISQLENAATLNTKSRLTPKIQEKINEISKSKPFWRTLSQQMFNCPKRIVHYDTKISNILFDKNNNTKAIIDLDTTMPGFIFFDYGDMIRSMSSKNKEDEMATNQVKINKNLFEAITEGYLSAVGDWITPIEKSNLLQGSMYIIFENSIRFLTDHINGDVYFKTSRKNQNLQRFKTQYKLYEDLKNNFQKYQKIIFSI
ncbi:hypothetical protein CL643_04275 [bacterium]|nr:hypothetical protein [bacterium]